MSSLFAQSGSTIIGPPPERIQLTDEQRARIQRNRELALQRRAEAEERNRQRLGLVASMG